MWALKENHAGKSNKNLREQEQPRHTEQETPNKINTFKILTLHIYIYEGDACSDEVHQIYIWITMPQKTNTKRSKVQRSQSTQSLIQTSPKWFSKQ